MNTITMSRPPKKSKKAKNTFWFRDPITGRGRNMALGPCPKHIAAHRLDGIRKGATVLPQGADLIHFIRTGLTTPRAPKSSRKAPASHVKPLSVRDILTWSLHRPKLLTKSERAREEQEADHAVNLRRAVDWFGRVIDLDQPPPLTAPMFQKYIDARLTDPKLQPGGVPGAKTLRGEVGCIRALFNHWAKHHGQTLLYRIALEYPEERELPPFRSIAETVEMIDSGGLDDNARQEAWHSSFPTVDECRELLEYVRSRTPPAWLPAMVAWAAYTGCRASEVRRARLTDWKRATGEWDVRERKRTKDAETIRTAPIPAALATCMDEWFAVRPESAYLFCWTRDSGVFKVGDKLGGDQVRNVLDRVLSGSRWADFPGMHRFRHGFRSNALAAGVPERVVDGIVGHTTEACRKRYTHTLHKTKVEAVNAIFGEG